MRIELLKRYGARFGGNRLSAFFGFHTFSFGGETSRSLHLWPLCIIWEAQS